MTFDNVEAIKSLVAVGLGASIVPSLCLGTGHVAMGDTVVLPLSPRARRRVGLVKLRQKSSTTAMQLVSAALLTLRRAPERTRPTTAAIVLPPRPPRSART